MAATWKRTWPWFYVFNGVKRIFGVEERLGRHFQQLAGSRRCPRQAAPRAILWCGSILNSLPVVLLGGATGTHSATLKPSTLLKNRLLAPLLYLHAILPAAS